MKILQCTALRVCPARSNTITVCSPRLLRYPQPHTRLYRLAPTPQLPAPTVCHVFPNLYARTVVPQFLNCPLRHPQPCSATPIVCSDIHTVKLLLVSPIFIIHRANRLQYSYLSRNVPESNGTRSHLNRGRSSTATSARPLTTIYFFSFFLTS